MTHRPRVERDAERLRAAAAAKCAATDSAMDRALAQIAAAFGAAAAVNDFKLRVERLCRLGPRHPALRARFGARAQMLRGCNLTSATAKAERWWREERRAFQIASAFGYGNRLSLEVLRELRLTLRLMRFKRMEAEFTTLAAVLRGDAMEELPAQAAE
jgi:hypothetical protein